MFARLGLSLRLRKERFDEAFLFQNAFAAAIVSFFAKKRVGYARDLRGPLLTSAIEPSKEILAAHEVFYHLNLLGGADGVDPAFSFPSIPPDSDNGGAYSSANSSAKSSTNDNANDSANSSTNSSANDSDNAALGEFLLLAKNSDFVMAAAPGASFGGAKRAPLSLFAKTAELLLSDRPRGCLAILGGASEAKDANSLAEALKVSLKGRVFDLSGKTSLKEALGILRLSSLVLANDSGIMHLAGAAGAKTLAFIGPTDPVRTGPTGPDSAIMRAPRACGLAPCRRRECPLPKRLCLDDLKAEDAAAIADVLIKGPEGMPAGAPLGFPALLLAEASPAARTPSGPESDGPLRLPHGAEPSDMSAWEALAASEGVDLGRSVLVGGDLDALGACSKAFGCDTVLHLGASVPEGLAKGAFLPKMTAPTLAFALSYGRALLAHRQKDKG
jgi:heptosyltransferase-2